jgi:uncharacterized protein (TIGR03435 family)
MMRRVVLCAILLASVPLAAAQAPPSQSTEVVFDVASIRPNTTASDTTRWRISPGGGYAATRISLVDLMLMAYGIERFQLVGGPPWMRSDRFDIAARATVDLTTSGTRPTLPGALRTLLKDRFGLVEHTESREFPVYVLKVAREGRLGPNLTPTDVNCAGSLFSSVSQVSAP